MCIYIYIYIYMYVYTCMSIHTYIYIYRERERCTYCNDNIIAETTRHPKDLIRLNITLRLN